jgi:two-component system sensor histidine kinase VicK
VTTDQEIDKAKNEFVTLASHQLRTPPTAVKWYTESLLSHPANLDEKQKKYLHEIYRSNKRMIYLVNSLLNISRIELGTFVVDTSLTDMRDGIRVILEELVPMIKEKNLSIYKHFDEPLPLISIDPRLMIIILQNLISNAIKYTPFGGSITIGLTISPEKDMVFSVSDTGCGIPADQQKKIFTKLFRADNANDYDPDGSGLGLYITKSIIDQTGGKIWFESTEGSGTAFHVSYSLEKGMKGKRGTQNLI